MAKFRVYAECISDCYIDVEAKDEEEARNRAAMLDGGDFHEDYTGGDWRIGSALPLADDSVVDYLEEDFEDCEESDVF